MENYCILLLLSYIEVDLIVLDYAITAPRIILELGSHILV